MHWELELQLQGFRPISIPPRPPLHTIYPPVFISFFPSLSLSLSRKHPLLPVYLSFRAASELGPGRATSILVERMGGTSTWSAALVIPVAEDPQGQERATHFLHRIIIIHGPRPVCTYMSGPMSIGPRPASGGQRAAMKLPMMLSSTPDDMQDGFVKVSSPG